MTEDSRKLDNSSADAVQQPARSPVASATSQRRVAPQDRWLRRNRGCVLGLLALLLMLGASSLVAVAGWLLQDTASPPSGLVIVRRNTVVLVQAGAERTLVTMPGQGLTGNPAVSPDGRRLAFTYLQGHFGTPDWGGDLYALDLAAEGSPARPELLLKHDRPGEAVEGIAWSPDAGSLLIAYRSAIYEGEEYKGLRYQLETFDLATRGRRVVVPDAADPSWSPDGKRIAYKTINSPNIWVARPDGKDAMPVTQSGNFADVQSPRFSPDGSKLVFAGVTRGLLGDDVRRSPGWLARLGPPSAEAHGVAWDLWTWSEGAKLERLSRLGQDQMYAAWSPDGRELAVVTDVGLYVLDSTGGDAKRITLRADGRGLVWVRTGPGADE